MIGSTHTFGGSQMRILLALTALLLTSGFVHAAEEPEPPAKSWALVLFYYVPTDEASYQAYVEGQQETAPVTFWEWIDRMKNIALIIGGILAALGIYGFVRRVLDAPTPTKIRTARHRGPPAPSRRRSPAKRNVRWPGVSGSSDVTGIRRRRPKRSDVSNPTGGQVAISR